MSELPTSDSSPAASRPLSISILIESTAWGGAELHTAALARTLAERGHTVAVVPLDDTSLDRFRSVADGMFEVRSLGLGPRVGAVPFRAWREQLASLPGDVGVMAKSWLHSGSLSLDLAARRTFGRYVAIEHLIPPPPPEFRRGRGLGLWWYRRMATIRLRARIPRRIFCVSQAVLDALARDYGHGRGRMTVMRNGADGDRFRPSQMLRTDTRAAWGIPDDAVVFGTVGRLSISHKGLDLAIEAFARIASRDADSPWLVLVGSGPDRAELLDQAASTPARDRIRFVGHVESPETIYPALDVFTMPSRSEGLPLSLMEAMACGCIPVATAVGGIPEVITDPALGWVVPAENAAALSQAMSHAVALSAEDRRAMGERGRAHILDHFNAGRQFRNLAAAIETESVRHG